MKILNKTLEVRCSLLSNKLVTRDSSDSLYFCSGELLMFDFEYKLCTYQFSKSPKGLLFNP